MVKLQTGGPSMMAMRLDLLNPSQNRFANLAHAPESRQTAGFTLVYFQSVAMT